MKKYLILFISIFTITLNCIPVFAGWLQTNEGWKYAITTNNFTQGAPTIEINGVKYAKDKYWYIEGKYHVFNDQGLMQANTTIDGHQLDSEGYLLDDNGQIYTKSPSQVNPKGFASCVDSCYSKIPGGYSQTSNPVDVKVEGYTLKYRKDCSGFVSLCAQLFNILNYNTDQSLQYPIFSTKYYTDLNGHHFTKLGADYITSWDFQPGDIWIKPNTLPDEPKGHSNGHAIVLTNIRQTSNGKEYTFKHVTSGARGKTTTKVTNFSNCNDNSGNPGLLPNDSHVGKVGYSVFYRAQ